MDRTSRTNASSGGEEVGRDERRVAHNVGPLIFNAVSVSLHERAGVSPPSPVKAGYIKVAIYKEVAHQHPAESSRKDAPR